MVVQYSNWKKDMKFCKNFVYTNQNKIHRFTYSSKATVLCSILIKVWSLTGFSVKKKWKMQKSLENKGRKSCFDETKMEYSEEQCYFCVCFYLRNAHFIPQNISIEYFILLFLAPEIVQIYRSTYPPLPPLFFL